MVTFARFETRLAACILGFLLVIFTAEHAQSETWKIASPEWPPYAGADLPENGRAIHKLRRVLSRAGISLEVDFMPWSRARAVAMSKDYIGVFPAWPTEVNQHFVASDPVDFSRIAIIKRVETTLTTSCIDGLFQEYRVGFVAGHVYPAPIQRLIYQHYQPEDGSENEEDLVRVLAAGRIDAALSDPAVLLHLADKLQLNGIDPDVDTLEKHALVLAFSRTGGYRQRLERFNDLLRTRSD
ncbi:hypothetical protein [Roseibium sp.]|uniref:hypothetical protein n=1 Tax=Roseibium sp. TaxID=1936156 RepID=UPI003B503821